MMEINQMKSDLGYVAEALRKSDRARSPVSIYLLWAAIVLVGFALIDFAPRYEGMYWTVLGPLGLLISALLGSRYSLRLGQVRRDLGVRYSLHWLGMMAIIFLAVPLGVTGAVAWGALSKFFLLIIALAYFLAGVHLERPLLWISCVIVAGYVALFFIPAYGWTIMGAMMAVALAATGLLGGGKSVAATS
jgi:hypothetical protein